MRTYIKLSFIIRVMPDINKRATLRGGFGLTICLFI